MGIVIITIKIILCTIIRIILCAMALLGLCVCHFYLKQSTPPSMDKIYTWSFSDKIRINVFHIPLFFGSLFLLTFLLM